MDEISNCRSIWGIPVCAKNVKHWLRAREYSGNNRDQVAWFLSWIFPKNTGLVAANLVHMIQSPDLFPRKDTLTGLKYRRAVIDQEGSDNAMSARIDSHMNFDLPYGDVRPMAPGSIWRS